MRRTHNIPSQRLFTMLDVAVKYYLTGTQRGALGIPGNFNNDFSAIATDRVVRACSAEGLEALLISNHPLRALVKECTLQA